VIPGDDFDLAKGIALCRPCGEVVALPRAEMVAAHSEKLYRPSDVRFEERLDGADYVAMIPPNRVATLGALFFCLFWDAFLVLWYSIAFKGGSWLMGAFATLHLAVGVYFTHQTIAALLNTRVFRIGGGRVTYRSGPIPLAGKLDVAFDEIDSFGTSEIRGRRVAYAMVANLRNGTQKKLDVVTDESDGTRYIAASLNDALARAREGKPAELPPYRG
jgi:hypothetical protein